MSIEFKNVNYIYNQGTPFEYQGLKDISFNLTDGNFIAIIGHTGSGKSTLLQHFDALLKPTSGEIKLAGFDITSKTTNKNLKSLRKKVGIVFQFPENQLFAETILKDAMFGPLNFGMDADLAEKNAKKWLKRLGIKEELYEQSPFDLSGGQMRRVAIAGVLAYEPEILCLDEPAAGLDPVGRKEIMSIFKEYQKNGHTVILITHEMDDVAQYADDVLVLQQAKLIKHTTVADLFENPEWLAEHYLNQPHAARFAQTLKQNGFKLKQTPLTIEQLAKSISKKMREYNE
ncbi:energy-coupling factor transporter ATPase [uncultured Lactobacillus sp.]|uniref:energy-coupling factor transporter ATPase n=1 Tax=uncultured Lactobacillus sp. TaxID=153152 RepID=UPI0026063910|nr:energy-coupling factor transporter ATPase [uncultured Lactobacillus sp.]